MNYANYNQVNPIKSASHNNVKHSSSRTTPNGMKHFTGIYSPNRSMNPIFETNRNEKSMTMITGDGIKFILFRGNL
jgi:hypothetical protein